MKRRQVGAPGETHNADPGFLLNLNAPAKYSLRQLLQVTACVSLVEDLPMQ